MLSIRTFGYIFFSEVNQHDDTTLIGMGALGVPETRIYTDMPDKDDNRPAYQSLINRLKAGDLLYINSIDSLGCDYEEILNQWRFLTKERGVDISVIDVPFLDTRKENNFAGASPAEIVIATLCFATRNERTRRRRRQSECIEAARVRGVRFGRPVIEIPENFSVLVKQWEGGNLSFSELLTQTGMTKPTFYRRLKDLRNAK